MVLFGTGFINSHYGQIMCLRLRKNLNTMEEETDNDKNIV